jgi:hypothetical protein
MQRFWFAILAMAFSLSCSEGWQHAEPPTDHPYFPSSFVQNDTTLFVFSSNFDQRYEHANVMSVDLSRVDSVAVQENAFVGTSAVTSSAIIPSFPDGATLSPDKTQILYLSRGETSLRTIPLKASGSLIACPNAAAALGQDCFSQKPAAALDQANPYYLTLFSPNQQDLSGGVVGYILDPVIRRADEKGEFNLPEFFEFERFTWNSVNSTAQVTADIGIAKKLSEPGSVLPAIRSYNARVGGLTSVAADNHIYFLTERPKEGGGMVASNNPQIARISLADFQNAPVSTLAVEIFELSAFAKSVPINILSVRSLPNALQFFFTNGPDGRLYQFEMPLNAPILNGRLNLTQRNHVPVCNHPNDIKLSPNEDKLVVACEGGRIIVYDADTLEELGSDPASGLSGSSYGRGPIAIHFDKRTPTWNGAVYRFYVANFLDGSLSVFNLTRTPAQNQPYLTRQGHIFQPSPLNREGGAE